jgi:hypothetical protein
MYVTREPDIGRLLRICECCGFRDVPELVGWYLFKERCPALCLSCGYIEDQVAETFAPLVSGLRRRHDALCSGSGGRLVTDKRLVVCLSPAFLPLSFYPPASCHPAAGMLCR